MRILWPLLIAAGCDPSGSSSPTPEPAPELPCEEAWAPEDAPIRVDSYTWEGREVYLAQHDCCDFFDEVLDATTCAYLCAPSGGFSGIGDGQCPNFFEDAVHNDTVYEAR